MWVALGFVTLALSVGYQWWMRWHQNWKGIDDTLAGIPCETKVRSKRSLVYGLIVSVGAPETFRFELKQEGVWDRFFKWIGLTHEHQFGHAGFDPLVYIASDDQHLFSSLAENKNFLHAAQSVFSAKFEDRWIKKIVCAQGRVWMVIGCSDGFEEASLERNRDFAARLLPHLQQIQKALDACMPDSKPSERDRYLVPAVVVLALSSGLAVNGFISWTRTLLSPEFMLDTQHLKLYAWSIAACIVAVLALAAILFLRGSSRVHLVLIELALVGTFGAVTTSSSALRDANIGFDTSPALLVHTTLIGKSISERKRLFRSNRTTYQFKYREWIGGQNERLITVSAAEYQKASFGDTLVFEQHQGYFGWRWAEFKASRPRAAGLPAT
jgi:hypothetical protein